MGDKPKSRIRFPTVELFALNSGGAFATNTRPLLPTEKKLAETIFQNAIDYSAVRIVTSPVVSSPTTLANNIRVRSGHMSNRTLIHELAHIWQFQTKGLAYISDSAWHQSVAFIATGNRNAAYDPKIKKGQSIHDYTAEHQAVIIERYFAIRAFRNDPEYQRMIGEVRKSRPVPENVRLEMAAEEAAFGADTFSRRQLPPKECGGACVPLLRIEF